MIFDAVDFVFIPPPAVSRARRILIKPCAYCSLPHPITTSRETLSAVIEGIRRVSDANIFLLEGARFGESMHSIYRTLGYDFPRVMRLDVQDCIAVEVENLLAKPFALATIWVPNMLLSCDYLITIAPFRVIGSSGNFSLGNLLGLIPPAKYGGQQPRSAGYLERLGIDKVIADLYFTLPFDLGIVDGRKKLTSTDDPTQGFIEDYGKIFVGEPYDVDREASKAADVKTDYLRLIEIANLGYTAQRG